jgi:glycine hydroxymethyltransferase
MAAAVDCEDKMSAGQASNSNFSNSFFSAGLADTDPEIARAIELEMGRQREEIELIASENIVSRAVLEAQGSIMTNKYAEGYPGRRYYAGCQFVDIAEKLAIERACRLFECGFANVQPNSGSQANQAVFMALMKPGDTFMGLDLAAGGHLTHGAPVNVSGKWFNVVSYNVRPDDQRVDMEEVERLAHEHKPKVIVAGGSAYPRFWDFAKFREIADAVGAHLMVDMAHFAGLVAGGAHPSPFPHAHVATTTTHKTLRGPRGGMILTNDEALAKKFNSAIFPGIQGGPLMHVIAGKAVAFGEALRPEFKLYARAVADNAKVLAETIASGGYAITTGGTDNHLMLVDLRPKKLTGKAAEAALTRSHITCNKNGVPFDPEKPMVTSGVRLGTPACTTRGFGVAEFKQVGEFVVEAFLGRKGELVGDGAANGAPAGVCVPSAPCAGGAGKYCFRNARGIHFETSIPSVLHSCPVSLAAAMGPAPPPPPPCGAVAVGPGTPCPPGAECVSFTAYKLSALAANRAAFAALAGAFGLYYVLSVAVMVWRVKERPLLGEAANRVPLVPSFMRAFKNDAFRPLLVAWTLESLGMSSLVTMAPFFIR